MLYFMAFTHFSILNLFNHLLVLMYFHSVHIPLHISLSIELLFFPSEYWYVFVWPYRETLNNQTIHQPIPSSDFFI